MQARHTFTDQPQTVEPDPPKEGCWRMEKSTPRGDQILVIMTGHQFPAVGGEARSEGGEPEAFGVR